MLKHELHTGDVSCSLALRRLVKVVQVSVMKSRARKSLMVNAVKPSPSKSNHCDGLSR